MPGSIHVVRGTHLSLAVCLSWGAALVSCEKDSGHAPPSEPAAASVPQPAAASALQPAAAEAPSGPPKLPADAILRPMFATTEGDISAGTAFLVKADDGRILLLTAQHLFGEMGGLARTIPAAELPKVFKSVTATSADDHAVSVQSATLVALPNAGAFDREGYAHDLAAFAVTDAGKAGILALAGEPPKKGDVIWLAAEVIGSNARLHRAHVEAIAPQVMMYSFDDKLELRATSGAPLVDAKGRVVGINLAGGESGGKLLGGGGPVTAMRAMLASAAKDAK